MPARREDPTPTEIFDLLGRHHPHAHAELETLRTRWADIDTWPPQFSLERARFVAKLRGDVHAVNAAAFLRVAKTDGAPRSEAEQRIIESSLRILSTRWDQLGGENPENLRRMVVAMAADARVLLVVLADRVLQIEGVRDLDAAERKRIASETLEIFAPLANRMGVWQVKWRLKDLALRELEPEVYKQLKSLLAETRSQRDGFVATATEQLQAQLQRVHIRAQINGRPKHIFSIYNKMRRKGVGFDEIYDVSALRVIVPEISDCYAVLGIVHGLWAPISGEFDDYIARPKSNMYQSLHTAVHGPAQKPLEIQIRTQAMHEFAEFGVAAHWSYKEGGQGSRADRHAAHQFDLLHQLMDWQRQIEDHESFAEALRTELFREQVYVFTPKGDVLAFPRGATPLDFAYRVHTQVGHRCRGAKINGRIVPLQTEMRTGDHLEILTQNNASPSRDWLSPQAGYIHTTSARQKIRQWFRQQGREAALEQGRELFERAQDKLNLKQTSVEEVAKRAGFENAPDMLAALGYGDLTVHRVSTLLLDIESPPPPEDLPVEEVPPVSKREPARAARGVRVNGMGEILSQPANCCLPLPGDDVIGFMSRGRGITLHRRDCSNARARQDPERWIEIEWGTAEERRGYPVELELQATNRPGILRRLTELVAQQNLNTRSLQTREQGRDGATIAITVDVRSHDELLRLITRLEQSRDFHDVRRRQR